MPPIKRYNTDPDNNILASPDGAPENMAPSGVNNTIRQIMADVRVWFNLLTHTETASSDGRAYTLTTGDGSADPVTGDVIALRLNRNTAQADATLAVNGSTAAALKDGNGASVAAGGFLAGIPYLFYFDGTDYRCLNLAATQTYLEDTVQVRKLRNGTPTLELSSAGQLDLKTNASTTNLRVTTGGDLHVEGTVIAKSTAVNSDERDKENIRPLEDTSAAFKHIQPYSFRYKGKHHEHVGFVAQNLHAVDPRLVKVYPHGETGEKWMGVRTTGLVAVLWDQVTRLTERLDALEARQE